LVKMEVRKENRNIRDNHHRLLAEKFELKRNLYKALVRDPTLPQEMRELHAYKLAKLPRNSSFTRVRNRCVFTGRPRGVYQLFRMSRLVFRSLASQGLLEGIRKASW
jgi:small subunit ribosomal protein S14